MSDIRMKEGRWWVGVLLRLGAALVFVLTVLLLRCRFDLKCASHWLLHSTDLKDLAMTVLALVAIIYAIHTRSNSMTKAQVLTINWKSSSASTGQWLVRWEN